MKIRKLKILFCAIILILYILNINISHAHSGRTDSNGGHTVRTEGHGYPVGSYHYHNGSGTSTTTQISNTNYTNTQTYEKPEITTDKINEINYGEEKDLNININNDSGNMYTVTSSDTNVITCIGGRIQAVGIGKATVNITYPNAETEILEIEVKPTYPTDIEEIEDIEIKIEDSMQVTPILVPDNISETQISWKSMNTDIANVNEQGIVKGISKGSTNILVETENEIKEEFEVTVEGIYPEAIDFIIEDLELNEEGKYVLDSYIRYDFHISYFPDNTTEKGIEILTNNENIEIKDDVLTITKCGDYTIEVKGENGTSITKEIFVNKSGTEELSETTESVVLGIEYLILICAPTGAIITIIVIKIKRNKMRLPSGKENKDK